MSLCRKKNSGRLEYAADSFYRISVKEHWILAGKSAAAVVLLTFCFYRKAGAVLFLLPVGVMYYRRERGLLLGKKKDALLQQFKELLQLTVASLKAGYSVENAFLKGREDMTELFGEESGICRILGLLKRGLQNNRSLSGMWQEIGRTCQIEEISDFAEVFSVAKESGGNMVSVMEQVCSVIEGRAETKKEIAVMLSARILEQKIMDGMPFLIILYITVTSPGYFDACYSSPAGNVLMTGCLFLYLFAYYLSCHLVEVEV